MSELFLSRAALTAATSFIGLVSLLSLVNWNDRNILWWLSYVILAGACIGGGKERISPRERAALAAIPGLVLIVAILIKVLVLGRREPWSSITPDDPAYWALVALAALLSFLFAWLFSYMRKPLRGLARRLTDPKSAQKLDQATTTLTALVGVLSAIGLLVSTLMPK